MRVLMSAYACDPTLGSENAVGWSWAMDMAKNHDLHVLTQGINREPIERYLAGRPGPKPIFHYYDLPGRKYYWGAGTLGIRLHYVLWQRQALRMARRLHRETPFDMVHHTTMVTLVLPSFLGGLGIPFVLGPVAGGEYAPAALWRGLGLSANLRETARMLLARSVRFSPLHWGMFRRAKPILVTSEQTRDLLPPRARSKCSVLLQVGLDLESHPVEARHEAPEHGSGPFRILYAGRFLYWKGMEHGLHAFRRLLDQGVDAELHMVGFGRDEARWKNLAMELGLGERVAWRGRLPREQLMAEMGGYHCFLFPSLHDSGGMVVLEAMAAGVPVVCLDVGGPGVIVDRTCGRKVPPGRPEQVVQGLAKAMAELAQDPELCARLAQGAPQRVARDFSREGMARRMGQAYEAALAGTDMQGAADGAQGE